MANIPDTMTCAGTCGRTLRRKHLLKKDFPNTISLARFDRCAACVNDYLAANAEPPADPKKRARYENNIRGLNNFMARIRGKSQRRGIAA